MSLIQKFTSFYEDLASMQVDQLQTIYANDVNFIDPIAHHSGLPAVEAYFERLLKNAKYCTFEILSVEETTSARFVVEWKMTFTSAKMKAGSPIVVDGLTILHTQDDLIILHRDYYDLGQMVYENIPLLGRLIKRIRRGMQ